MSKEDLTQFLNSIVNKDEQNASDALHNYLKDKMQSIIYPQEKNNTEDSTNVESSKE